jgi:hypothetical protein
LATVTKPRQNFMRVDGLDEIDRATRRVPFRSARSVHSSAGGGKLNQVNARENIARILIYSRRLPRPARRFMTSF